MKKILTLLLLAAFFAIPRNAQAQIEWQIATGNEWRIDPARPDDPNALVQIPAGTKFFYLRGVTFKNNSSATNGKVYIIMARDWFFFYPFYPSTSGLADAPYYILRNVKNYNDYIDGAANASVSDISSLIYRSKLNIPFASYNPITSDRLIIRTLGYDWINDYLPNTSSGSSYIDKYNNTITEQQAFNYLSKLVMTEEEALAITKLDLSPLSYGLSPYYIEGSGSKSTYFDQDLSIFKNVEELDLSNCSEVTNSLSTYFPKLKKLTLCEMNSHATIDENFTNLEYFKFGGLRPLDLLINNVPKLKTLVLGCNVAPYMGTIKVKNCPNLVTIDADFASYHKLDCSDNNIEVLKPGKFDILLCDSNNLTELTIKDGQGGPCLSCSANMLETLNISAKARPFVMLKCNDNNLSSLNIANGWSRYTGIHINYEHWDSYALVSEKINTNRIYLDCSKNNITTLNLSHPTCSLLTELYCWNNQIPSLDLSASTNLWRLRMSNNKVKSLDLTNNRKLKEIYANNNLLTTLDCSNLTYLQEAQLSRNKMTNLDMSGCSSVKKLLCNAQGGDNVRLLDTLNLTGCTALTTLECQNNALTSLNLSTCTSLTPSGVKAYMQRAVKDVKVFDRNKVCIELPNGVTPAITDNSTISNADMDNYFGTWTGSGFDKTRNKVIKRGGKTYLVLHDISDDARGGAQTKADVDFYGKQMKYQYALFGENWDETLGGSLANDKKTDNVTVTVYPYVMYINPLTHDVYTDSVNQENQFYSGTIYLDYDAVVPEGTEVYIAQGLQYGREDMITGGDKTTSGQLNLVKIEKGEGAARVVIPALTPVYVKSPSETGLFSFDRNLDNEALGVLPAGVTYDDNIFKGTLTPLTVDPLSVLTLSRGFKSSESGPTAKSRVGFWRFNNTVVPAHRVYIEATEMDKIGGSNVRGLTFAFFDSEEELPTSINSMPTVDTFRQNNEGWYTISGVRLKAKPTAKGVYIYNGKKVIINQ